MIRSWGYCRWKEIVDFNEEAVAGGWLNDLNRKVVGEEEQWIWNFWDRQKWRMESCGDEKMMFLKLNQF